MVTSPRARRLLPGMVFLGVGLVCGVVTWWLRHEPTPGLARPAASSRSRRSAMAHPVAGASGPGSARTGSDGSKGAPGTSPDLPPHRGPAPPARFKERSKSEWQGMLIDVAVAPTCASTERCGMAQSCKPGPCGPGEPTDGKCFRCQPCESNGECARGEICVLDHCVKREFVSCRTARDCGGVPCVLSGYSTGIRNNQEMKAYCPDVDGGTYSPDDEPEYTADDRKAPLQVDLQEQIRRSYAQEP